MYRDPKTTGGFSQIGQPPPVVKYCDEIQPDMSPSHHSGPVLVSSNETLIV